MHTVVISVSVVGWSVPLGLAGLISTFPVDDISQVVEAVTISTVILPTFLYCFCACSYYWCLSNSNLYHKSMPSLPPSFVFSLSLSPRQICFFSTCLFTCSLFYFFYFVTLFIACSLVFLVLSVVSLTTQCIYSASRFCCILFLFELFLMQIFLYLFV